MVQELTSAVVHELTSAVVQELTSAVVHELTSAVVHELLTTPRLSKGGLQHVTVIYDFKDFSRGCTRFQVSIQRIHETKIPRLTD